MIRFWDFKLSGAPPLLSWVSFGVNRMTRDVLRDNYRESWANLSAFVERFPDDQWLDWKNFMRPVVRAAIEAGLSDHFRAGQSMSHLIFSTAEEHGLEPIEPPPLRVTLGRDDASTFFVALSRSEGFHMHRTNQCESAVAVLTSGGGGWIHETSMGL